MEVVLSLTNSQHLAEVGEEEAQRLGTWLVTRMWGTSRWEGRTTAQPVEEEEEEGLAVAAAARLRAAPAVAAAPEAQRVQGPAVAEGVERVERVEHRQRR